MLKWKATKDGRTIIGLGIERVNVQRLKKGQPIHIYGEEIGVPFDIVIAYGETAQDLVDDLKKSGATLPPVEEWKPSRN